MEALDTADSSMSMCDEAAFNDSCAPEVDASTDCTPPMRDAAFVGRCAPALELDNCSDVMPKDIDKDIGEQTHLTRTYIQDA